MLRGQCSYCSYVGVALHHIVNCMKCKMMYRSGAGPVR